MFLKNKRTSTLDVPLLSLQTSGLPVTGQSRDRDLSPFAVEMLTARCVEHSTYS